MSDTKVKMIVVDSGELYVFGKLISRHPEMPWLFSITDVYKACEVPLKREAKKYGKDPEVTYVGKKPANWLNKNSRDSLLDAIAKDLRKHLKKYGIGCGFTVTNSNDAKVSLLSNRELCIKTVKGNTKLRGTYVCQDLVTGYAGSLNDKLKAKVFSTFTAVLNGYTEEVTKKVEKNERIAKGTPARQENKQLNNRLVEVCGMKNILPMKVQEGINEGTFGMTATQLKKSRGIKEPFNDNITETEAAIKNIAIILATTAIRMHPAVTIKHKDGRAIGVDSGIKANETLKSHITKYSCT